MGACIGEAVLTGKIGKKALLLGAITQSVPDIDFIASFWNDPAGSLLSHRAFTHSLLFVFIAVIFFSLLMEHYFRPHKIGYQLWIWFFALELGAHLFLDLFNSYGMGIWEPFSHYRYSWNALFVADPFFSIGPALAFIALLIVSTKDRRRYLWKWLGIGWCGFYLLYAVYNKVTVDKEVQKILAMHYLPRKQYFTTPAPFNNWLWYVVTGNEEGFFVGYYSIFDRTGNISFHYFPKNDSILTGVKDHQEVQELIRFSQGFYTVEKRNGQILFNILRFGQIAGWYNGSNPFVFRFYVQHPIEDNKLALQRGRFTGWNKKVIDCLMVRIEGR